MRPSSARVRRWRSPAEVIATLRELEHAPGQLRDDPTFIDAVRYARASSHTRAEWLAISGYPHPRVLGLLMWEAFRSWPVRPVNPSPNANAPIQASQPTTPPPF